MSDNVGWTPRRNREISYEEGLAMIDNFYDGSAPPELIRAPDLDTTAPSALDPAKATDRAHNDDDARTAAAIAQLSHSPVAHPSKEAPIFPSSPPREYPQQWQPHWTHNRPLAFTSPPVTFSNAPPPTPNTGFPIATDPEPFAVASHIKPIPSPLQSKTSSPNTAGSKMSSPVFTSIKEVSPIFSATNTASPALTASKISSPALTETPTPVLAPAVARASTTPVLTPSMPRANIPPIPPPSLPSANNIPLDSPTVPNTNRKESTAPPPPLAASNKVAKKHATDSPTASSPTMTTIISSTPASSTRTVKKSRCMRCVKQHGACDLDARHPCERCVKAGLSAAECIPREYKVKKKS